MLLPPLAAHLALPALRPARRAAPDHTSHAHLPPCLQGWLPFCFTFLGFSAALKLLLFITLFSVYSAAILYRLYLHSDRQGKMSLAGEPSRAAAGGVGWDRGGLEGGKGCQGESGRCRQAAKCVYCLARPLCR